MLNDLRDAQKLKAIVSRKLEDNEGEYFMEYLALICHYNLPIDDPQDEGARRVYLTLKDILRLDPEQILQLNKGRTV